MDPLSDRSPIAQHKANIAKHSADPLKAAEQSAATEIEHAMQYGAGEEGFVMRSIPGDKKTMDHGIRKATEVDIDIESQKSNGPEEYERMEGSKLFV